MAGITTAAKQSNIPSRALMLAAALVAAPGLAAAQAETDGAQSDAVADIIVTARKTDERLQDVPVSVAAFDASVIESAQIKRIDDIRALAPNVNISTAGDQKPNVTLRGVGSTGVVEGVGFYVNDVQQFEGQVVPFEDIERIEVLRGPQGTLYGGANIGGAIKYVTKRPASSFEGQVSVEVGDWDTRNLSATLSGPLSADFGARLTVFDERNDGYLYNTTIDRTIGSERLTGGRLTLAYDGAQTQAALYLYASREDRGDFVPYYSATNDRTYLRTVTADNQPPPYGDRNIYSAALQVDHSFGGLVLTSLSSLFRSNRDQRADLDFSAAPVLFVEVEQKKRVFSQELRLATEGDRDLKWLVGAFFQQRREPEDSVFNIIPAGVAIPNSQRGRFTQYAAFGNATYEAGRWAFEAGLRVEHDDNRLKLTGAASGIRKTGTEVLPRVSIAYKPNADLNAYASITCGFTPGSVLNERRLVSYDPETTTNYELGVKGSLLDGKLRFDAAAFYVDYANRLFQTNQIVPAIGLVATTNNIGSSRNYGFEASLTAKPVRELTLTAAFGLTKAEWGKAVIFEPNSGNPAFDLNGFTAPYAPEYQASLGADWKRPLSDTLSLGLRGDVAFIGEQYWNLANTRKQRPYQLVNIGARLEAERWELSASLKNLFNERYNVQYFTAAEVGAGSDIALLGRPRLWTLELLVRF
jgi:iron complex outermembrane receptor protein